MARARGYVSVEGRRKGEGRGWAGLGRKAEHSGPVLRERSAGHKEDVGQNVDGLQKTIFEFKQGFWIKNQRVQIFLN
jgi:hypothetical protein